jgi:hypothetical protein
MGEVILYLIRPLIRSHPGDRQGCKWGESRLFKSWKSLTAVELHRFAAPLFDSLKMMFARLLPASESLHAR